MAADPRVQRGGLRADTSESVCDPVTGKLMTRAVSLAPCGHVVDHDTAIRQIAATNLCPLDQQPIEGFSPNLRIRDLASRVGSFGSVQASGQGYLTLADLRRKILSLLDMPVVKNNRELVRSLELKVTDLMTKRSDMLISGEDSHFYERTCELISENGSVRDVVARCLTASLPGQAGPATFPTPPMAFGEEEWKMYFGDVGEVDRLPRNIEEILNAPCPYWQGRVRDTHLLTWIPRTVNGQVLTHTTLEKMIQQPLSGYPAELADICTGGNDDTEVTRGHWALLTKWILSGSGGIDGSKKLLGEGLLIPPYQPPSIFDAGVSILMHHARTGERLYRETFTYCTEKEWDGPWHLSVGGFYDTQLHIGLGMYGVGCKGDIRFGLSAVRIL